MSDVNGAFSLILTPQALPGKCGGCGKAKWEQGFIDTGLQFDFYGALIFCGECVLDMASKFGFITPEAADHLRSQIEALQTETVTQREALLGLEDAVDGLLRARAAIPTNIASDSLVTVPEIADAPSVTPESSVGDFVVTGSELLVSPGESETNDNSSEQEPVGVSSNNGEFAGSADIGLDL